MKQYPDVGGAAFAQSHTYSPVHEQVIYGEDGMTLLDYFAGQALVGLLPRVSMVSAVPAAQLAYEIARAMVAEKRLAEEPIEIPVVELLEEISNDGANLH